MKNNAQAILQFTGYPLEPIVALEINKSFQSRLFQTVSAATLSFATPIQTTGFVYETEDMDERWFSGYE